MAPHLGVRRRSWSRRAVVHRCDHHAVSHEQRAERQLTASAFSGGEPYAIAQQFLFVHGDRA
jgi:hypothetical protein